MSAHPHVDAALAQLGTIPGVVGSLVFDGYGVTSSAFPPVFDPTGLRALAGQLAGDSYFQTWVAGKDGALDLRYVDGHVAVRTVEGGAWLLVLCTAQANTQLLSMSLTQVLRRLRTPGVATGELARPAAAVPAPAPSPAAQPLLDQLRAIVKAELGEHATQALEILAKVGPKPRDLVRAAADVEQFTRLFISKKQADELAREMRELLGE